MEIEPKFRIKNTKSKWKLKKNHIKLSLREFLDGIIFLLYNTFFQFTCSYYQKSLESPIGYCTSPFFAEIALDKLELNYFEKPKNSVFFFFIYVDDFYPIIKKDSYNVILNALNNFDNNLKFTIELESNNKMNFLDMTIECRYNTFRTNWYRTSNSKYKKKFGPPIHNSILMV